MKTDLEVSLINTLKKHYTWSFGCDNRLNTCACIAYSLLSNECMYLCSKRQNSFFCLSQCRHVKAEDSSNFCEMYLRSASFRPSVRSGVTRYVQSVLPSGPRWSMHSFTISLSKIKKCHWIERCHLQVKGEGCEVSLFKILSRTYSLYPLPSNT